MYEYPVRHAAWSSYVDYLRLTHTRDDRSEQVAQAYHLAMLACARRTGDVDLRPERFKLLGYYGWKMGSAFWGESDNGYLIQCAGVGAAELFDLALPYTGVPRIDIQVTYWYERHMRGTASAVCEVSNSSRSKFKGRPWKIRYINGMGEGDTCYIGSRGKKCKFLRCYDKWHESGKSEDYRYAWRYEAELTDFHGRYAYETLRSLGQSDLSCLQVLSGYWQERGISLPYDRGLEAIPPGKIPIDITSRDRWLAWLSAGVAPSIQKWLALGVPLSDILKSLGLDGANDV